jgi:hypothetical protein
MKKIIIFVLIAILAGFVVLQLIPYGHDHSNPPVTMEPQWDSPETRALASRACFDCHSNETDWPWYSFIAPVSWLIQRDVEEGRGRLNFSEWGNGRFDEPWEIVEAFSEGYMPPAKYLAMHPEARFSDAERQTLIQGFQKTFTQ